MKRLLLVGLLLTTPGFAHAGEIVVRQTAANSIRINTDIAEQMVGFIDDVVARGFNGPVRCFARSGHMHHSLHYSGLACDFAQSRRNRTRRIMYHVRALAKKWGLRDGCTFHHPSPDCGHIEAMTRRAETILSASRHHRGRKRQRLVTR